MAVHCLLCFMQRILKRGHQGFSFCWLSSAWQFLPSHCHTFFLVDPSLRNEWVLGQEGRCSGLDGGLTLDPGLDQFKALFGAWRCGDVKLGLGWSLLPHAQWSRRGQFADRGGASRYTDRWTGNNMVRKRSFSHLLTFLVSSLLWSPAIISLPASYEIFVYPFVSAPFLDSTLSGFLFLRLWLNEPSPSLVTLDWALILYPDLFWWFRNSILLNASPTLKGRYGYFIFFFFSMRK